MSEEKYLSFPLCLLAMNADDKEILNGIASYCIVETGETLRNSMSAEELQGEEMNEGVSDWQLCAAIGCRVLGFVKNRLSSNVEEYDGCLKHIVPWRKRNGNDPIARIKRDLLLGCLKNSGISMREFRILAGIYSVIGRKSHACIGLRLIRARAHGCKTPGIMEKESIPEILTPKQARLTVQRLHELGWFARVTPDPHGRKTYYSHRLTRDQLREIIFTKLTFSQSFRNQENQRNAELLERIKRERGHLKNDGTLKEDVNDSLDAPAPFFDETTGHPEGTAATPEGQQKGTLRAPINRNTLNRNPPNTNPINTNPVNDHAHSKLCASPVSESGNVISGSFMTNEQTNAFIIANRERTDEIRKSSQPAVKITNPDGTVEIRILTAA
jgi:hypothetical protein